MNVRKVMLTAAALAVGGLQLLAQTVTVEPANWWVGMKEPRVQLLLHAKNVSALNPALASDEAGTGVQIGNVLRSDNPDYMFVDLIIGPDAKPGTINIELRAKKKKDNVAVPFELKQRRPHSAERGSFGPEDAIYLIMPDRFANGNPANDDGDAETLEKANRKEPYGRHGGDIQGVIDHLDYIESLGMTTVWLTPVLENNMPESSYHGYAITNFYRIDPRFGSTADFARLSAELHKRGMKHIMDQVLNHCGTNHAWARLREPDNGGKAERDMPQRDWLNIWRDKNGQEKFVRSNYRLSVVMDPHASQTDKDETLKGWFDTTMADINMSNPLVLTYMAQNSIWWIETADLDGIRLDTYPYSDPASLREWNRRIREEYPNFNVVGEAWISDPAKLAIWQENTRPDAQFNSGLKTIMDFPLQEAIASALNEPAGWTAGAKRIYDLFASDFVYPNPQNMLVFGENHDTGRLFTHLNGDTAALRLTMALIATVRGIPQLYYGTEMLMQGDGAQGHCYIREEFPGGWAWSDDQTNYFKERPEAQEQMHDLLNTLYTFRKTSPALTRGSMTHYLPQNNVYIYVRADAESGQRVLVMLNMGKESENVDLTRINELRDGILQGFEVIGQHAITAFGGIKLSPREALVIDLK